MKSSYFGLLFLSAFVFTDIFRIFFGEGSIIHRVNFLFVIGTILALTIAIRNNRIRPFMLYLVIFFSLLISLQVLVPQPTNKIYNLALNIGTYMIPLALMTIRITREEAIKLLDMFLKWFNPLIVVITIVGLIDYITDSSIQLWLADNYFNGTQVYDYIYGEHIWGVYRYYSLIALPLGLAKYFLLFYSLNQIYVKYHGKYMMNNYLVLILSVAGVILTGSKTAIVLLLVSILFFSATKRKFIYTLLSILAIWFFTLTPIYQENLKVRFMEGIESGDLSTGRNEAVKAVLRGDYDPPGFFTGGGINYSREVVQQTNVNNIYNFEYPFLMLPYDYGVLATILYYFILFLIPALVMIKNKTYFLLIHFLIMAVMVNTSNGLATAGTDYVAQYTLVLFIISNLGRYKIINETSKNKKQESARIKTA